MKKSRRETENEEKCEKKGVLPHCFSDCCTVLCSVVFTYVRDYQSKC